MTVPAYQLVAPNTPYICPVHPGPLVHQPNATQYQLAENRRIHELAVGDFHKVNTLESQLTKLLLSAYDRQWLNQITNPLTGAVNKTIPQIFDQLYSQYGQITSKIPFHKQRSSQDATKNIQSTKIQKSKSNQTQTVEDSLPLSTSLDVSPAQELTNSPTHNLFVAIHHTLDLKNKSYSDQTGRFPHLSSRGHQYIMILYDYDTNLILSLPLKHRRAADITN
jgi:hypothetical protein